MCAEARIGSEDGIGTGPSARFANLCRLRNDETQRGHYVICNVCRSPYTITLRLRYV